jgi:hypothetical protein
MLDNYPPDATPEQKGVPRSFISASYVPPEERMRGNTDPIPLDVTPTDEANIARNARTYGG